MYELNSKTSDTRYLKFAVFLKLHALLHRPPQPWTPARTKLMLNPNQQIFPHLGFKTLSPEDNQVQTPLP